ncbi:MAG: Holliday junction resolvase RecU [Rhodobacteraceae bacterium]|nr:Holliday junction resolvase RecU [Paracoccaceae bacterium]
MRGSELEKKANKANLNYRRAKEALILKVPTPIIYTAKGLIAQPSTVDYTGVIEGGTFLAFDAKETKVKTSFPLQNIHDHQLQYLEYVEDLGGIAFFLIHFKELYTDQAYVTPLEVVKEY